MPKFVLETPSETRDRCAAHGAEHLGDRIEWSPERNRLYPRGTVAALFEDHGMGYAVPRDSKPVSLLNKAGRSGHTPAGMLTREFVSPNPDTPSALHVSRVSGSGEAGDEFTCLARVRLEWHPDAATGESRQVAVALPPEGQTEYADRAAADRAAWIAGRYNELTINLPGGDLSKWIGDALEGTGGVKSVGGGNNYFVPPAAADRVHAFLSAVAGATGLHYVRDPKTTLGASHDRAVIGQSAEASLSAKIAELRDDLRAAVATAADPDAKRQPAFLARRIAAAVELRDKIAMYRAVLDASAVAPLDEAAELFRQHFATLADGGSGSDAWFQDAPAPVAPPAPEPESEPSGRGSRGDDGGGMTLAAATSADWWCC
jgi:hypothetical protein